MDPRILNLSAKNGYMYFTLSDVNVSIANAIRRVILTDIPIVVFQTFPYEKNKINIVKNTSRLNNEIIKQRLSCIPIHITDLTIALEDYVVEIKKRNDSDVVEHVTTEDIMIKNIKTDKYLTESQTRKIFPANSITKQYIDILRLQPKISEKINGEEFEMNGTFVISNAKDNSAYNVVSTCAYRNTPDKEGIVAEWKRIESQLKQKGMEKDEIEMERQNWLLLDGKRIFQKNSFDFTIETIGIFKNNEIVMKACENIVERLTNIMNDEAGVYYEVNDSETTMENCFDITLKNEDYTIGKIIEYALYEKYFEVGKQLSFVGFQKRHPHDDDSIIRISYKEETDKTVVRNYIDDCCQTLIELYKKIGSAFTITVDERPF